MLDEIQESSDGCCSSKILIVDDNDFNILPLLMILENQMGLEADKAKNGKQAFEIFKAAYEKPCQC